MSAFEPCHECGAAMDARQRYCISCGANRRHPDDPVARYLSASPRRARTAPAAPVVVAGSGGRYDGRLVAVAIALLPVAAAAGVLVGRNGADPDRTLIAALKEQRAALAASAPATTTTTTAATTAIASDFPLAKGFTIELQELPADSNQAAVDKATAAARDKGAKKVGVINPADFTLKPASGGGLVVYAGAYKKKAEAAKALGKLRKDFKGAKVVAVGPSAATKAASGGSKADKIAAEDAVVAKHPTQKQKQDGAKIVQQIQAKKGKSYVEQQQKLPDTIVIP